MSSESWGVAANLATTPKRLLALLPAGLPFLRASVGFPLGQVGPRSCPCSGGGMGAQAGQ